MKVHANTATQTADQTATQTADQTATHSGSRTAKHHSRTRRLALALLGAGIAIAAVAGVAAPANAVGTGGVGGQPGYVTVYTPQVVATEVSVPISYNPYTAVSYRVFSTNGALVYRSPATNTAQTIQATYYLQKYVSGRWQNVVNSTTWSGVVSGNVTNIRFASWKVTPNAQSAGTYRIVYALNWYNSAGQRIATEEVFPSASGETQCLTRTIGCTPYIDAVVLK